ncbi:MAG: glycosyltransferase family 39 protein [Alphaproteobacteria bacterium]|nr:glycosyltransferase family 39 protein [Alphaproteobacteria bacterium]
MTEPSPSSRLLAPAEGLAAALTDPARRERTVVAVLAGYVAIWTLYGVLAKSSQDLHVDMTEVAAWARELALGYPKHPPLSAWIAAVWFAVFPAADWAFYLLSMAVVGVALWIAWHLAGDYLDGDKRVLALVLLMLVPFFNFHALKYNANSVLLPMWAAAALCFLRSYERRSPLWAALAGLAAAGAILGKYWSVVLVLGLVLAALIDSRRVAYFRSPAPYVTAAVGALALAPHLAWLAVNDFAPFAYASARGSATFASALSAVGGYLAGSAGYAALAVVLGLAATRPSRLAAADMLVPATQERRLAAMAFWLPLLLPVVCAPLAGVRITSLWSMSAWALMPVVLLSSPLVAVDHRALLHLIAFAIALPVAMVAVAPGISYVIHRAGGQPAAVHSDLLAQRVAHEWRRRTDWPLRTVGGDADLAYGVAFYLPGRPSAFPEFNRKAAPWIDVERLRREGMAIVCHAADPTCPVAASAYGLGGPRVDVEISRSYFGVAGRSERYAIIVVPPRP